MSLDNLHAHSKITLPFQGEFKEENIQAGSEGNLLRMREYELKFIVPIKEALDFIYRASPNSLSSGMIEQSYMSDNLIPHVLRYIKERSPEDLTDCTPEKYSQSRIRRFIPSGRETGREETYVLALKEARTRATIYDREELPLGISQNEHDSMLNFLRMGTKFKETGFISKYRVTAHGLATTEGRPFKLEIDFIRAAGIGSNFTQYKAKDWPWVQIGCEVADRDAIQDIYNGKHSLQFLNTETRLVNTKPQLSKLISMRYIAKHEIKTNEIGEMLTLAQAA